METTIIQANDHALALAEVIPLERNPAAVYLAGLESKSGRRTMRQALDAMAGLLTGEAQALGCDWAKVRFSHAQALRSRLAEAYAPATVNKMLSALRGTLRAAWLLGQMAAEDYHKARAVENVKSETLPAGRELTAGEIAALFSVCENDVSPAGARDAAILATLYPGGLRRAEIVTLDLADVDPDTGGLKVRGKRRKERTAYLVGGARLALGDWLAVRGDPPGALFWRIRKGGMLIPGRMTTQAIYRVLQKRGRQAGVRDFSPHDLRRSVVSHLLAAGGDIATVARLMGHANVQTTARYDRRGESAKAEAAGLLHVPYRGRPDLFRRVES